ncbi:MAG: hypothetical protein V4684_09620 [Pseudomonadota bacterium]
MNYCTIRFSEDHELYVSADGFQELPSGTSPYHPDQVSAVRRNCELAMGLSEDDNDRICVAAKVGKAALIEELEDIFLPVGRAAEGRWQ